MSTASSTLSVTIPIHEGALLASRYEVQAFLGEGSFGKVAKCADIVTGRKVAVKITRDKPIFTERALEEIKILKQLQTLDPDRCNFVRFHGSFFHERLICLEFELLDLSLFDYMQRRHKPLSLCEIRPVLHQLTTALLHLEALEIIHADVKPENIMVVDRRQQPLQVKLIDFGLARHVSDVVQGLCVQTLLYRAPEVMVGMNFSESIDMWSLGLVAAELALSYPLFPGLKEYDMMKFIVDTLGQPPDYLLNHGRSTQFFFNNVGSDNQPTWRLKSPEEFKKETGHLFVDTRYIRLSSLDVLEELIRYRNKAKEHELQNFMDLLKKMLLVDQYGRIIPHKVLEHPFFTEEQHTDSSQNMNIKNETADMKETEQPVTQQPVLQKKNDSGLKLCDVAPRAMTPRKETVFTCPENASVKPEDEEDKAEDVQPGRSQRSKWEPSVRGQAASNGFLRPSKTLSSPASSDAKMS